MYLFVSIFVIYQTINGSVTDKNLKFPSLITRSEDYIDANLGKKSIFRLIKTEIDDMCYSIFQCIEINSRLIRHIKNLKLVKKCDGFCPNFTNLLENLIIEISKLKKNTDDKHVCKYEMLKFCEFFYQTLNYMIKHDEVMLMKFIQFSKKSILPFLENFLSEARKMQRRSKFLSVIEKVAIKKDINVEGRRHLLINFLKQFLEKQKIQSSIDHIVAYYSMNDLFSLCMNVFVRFALLKSEDYISFLDRFISEKYPISEQFIDFLCFNALLVCYTCSATSAFRKFLMKNNLHLEHQFLQEEKISPVLDVINKYGLILGLSKIFYTSSNIEFT